jgi:transmembrane sensor
MNIIQDLLKQLSEGKLTREQLVSLFDWIEHNKEEWQLSLYDEYRQLISKEIATLDTETSESILARIHLRLKDQPPAIPTAQELDPPSKGLFTRIHQFRIHLVAASALLLLVGLRYLPADFEPYSTRNSESHAVQTSQPVSVINKESKSKVVLLPDGSTVLLYPLARLDYSSSFDQNREVTLSGKAFFEVVKRPDAPFYVYANDVITKVLGTSFVIDAPEKREKFAISVKTGQVSVSTLSPQHHSSSQLNLVANEAAIFKKVSKQLVQVAEKSVEVSEVIVPSLAKDHRFKNTPVVEILSTLQRDYSIEIEVDERMLSDCSLTTTLNDKTLFEKLQIVCEAIGPGTSFAIDNGTVQIHTLGCNY